jgi:hypothetical protein
MTSLHLLWALARKTSVVCLMVLLAMVALMVGTWVWRMGLDKNLTNIQSDSQSMMAAYESARQRVQAIEKGDAAYTQALDSGLIGPAQREDWVRTMIGAYEALGFHGVPTFKLNKARPLDPPATTGVVPTQFGAGASSSNSSDAVGIFVHDLEFKLAGAHEGDVFSLLSAFQRDYPGRHRVVGCRLADPLAQGLSAECTLRFFNIDVPGRDTKGGRP